MAIQSGDFSPSQLVKSQMTADKMFADDMMKADFEANVDTWKAIKKEQNANVTILTDPKKDRDVTLHWINLCGEEAVDCDGDDCDLEGVELGTDSKDYKLELCKQFKFTVDEMTFRSNDYSMEQVVAKGLLKGDKILSEAITKSGIARIESFKGTNTLTNGLGTINPTTTETDIPSSDWNERLFAYLYRAGIMNQFSNPFLLSGSNLFEDRLVTMLAQANSEGKGAAALYKMMRTYFDLFNIDVMNDPSLKSYMINRGSVAFASKVYYGAKPTQYIGAGQMRWSIPSRNLDGHRIDIYYTNRCSGDTMKHDFKMKVHYDYFLNPTGCDAGRTGVLAFNKV